MMSELLDPMHRRQIERLGVGPGARTLEVGCGNGSISAWLAERVAPGGRAVAVDLDLSLVDAKVPGLELRQADIVAGPVPCLLPPSTLVDADDRFYRGRRPCVEGSA